MLIPLERLYLFALGNRKKKNYFQNNGKRWWIHVNLLERLDLFCNGQLNKSRPIFFLHFNRKIKKKLFTIPLTHIDGSFLMTEKNKINLFLRKCQHWKGKIERNGLMRGWQHLHWIGLNDRVIFLFCPK